MKIKVGPNWDVHGNAQVGVLTWVPYENKDGSQLGPTWECQSENAPVLSHVKIKMSPNWDQHGNAHVRMTRCVPYENKDGSQLGPTWDCPSGNAQVYPM